VCDLGADEKGHRVETTNEDQAQVEAREKAATLLRDRHERESEALATLIAAVSRRATAVEVVERETGQIASRLAEMSRLGFDDATLAELGIDIADVRASRTREQPAQDGWPVTSEPPAETRNEGEGDAEMNAAAPVTRADEHAGGVRTTADLESLVSPPTGVTTRPWSRLVGHAEPGTAPTR
jgi:hypothetical protein